MRKIIPFLLILLFWAVNANAQDRFQQIEANLTKLANTTTPGLKEKVDFSVVGVSIQEFLRGLAESNNLNISVDPKLDVKVYNNFTNEEVSNILLFLCREYELDIRFVGSIMSFYKYEPPAKPKKAPTPYEIAVVYDLRGDFLTMDLAKDTLGMVVRKISQESGKNVVLSPLVKQEQIVSVYIQKAPFDFALEKMAYSNGMKVKKTTDGFYLLEPAEEEEPEEKNGRNNSRNSRNQRNRQKSSGSSDEFFVEVKDSAGQKYIWFEANDMSIADAIREVSLEVKENYFLFSEPKGKITTIISKVTYNEFLGYILQGTEHTYKQQDDIFLIGERSLEGLRKTKVVQLQFRSFEEVMEVIPADLKKGVEVKEFQELNSFVMSGSSLQIDEIEELVKQIDKTVPMVMIEVIMVDLRRGRSTDTGLRAGKGDTSSAFSILPGIDILLSGKSLNKVISPLNIGQVTSDFYVGLKLLEEQNYANVHSMPKLSTLNGHEAQMSIGQTRYYSQETQNIQGSLNPNTIVTQQYNSVQADMSINIKPVISGNDQVTLDIQVEISDFIGDPPPNAPPASTNRQFTSMVRVRDNEMIVLGGMERTEKSESGTGLPLLSRIPIIKWFFSSRKKSKNKTIALVFIKPTIIH